MPIKWTISHPNRMVTVQAEEKISLPEAEEYLDALVVADAMPYAKLLVCTAMAMSSPIPPFTITSGATSTSPLPSGR